MVQIASQEWVQGWGVVRRIHQKLEFLAFFDTQEGAVAAANERGIGCQVCWISYRDGVGFGLPKNTDD